MSEVNLAFLWRLHQPWSVDPASGIMLLPWVRLHSASSYSDLAWFLESFPRLRATVAVSPALLDQIHLYLAGSTDAHAEITLQPAGDLTPEQRLFLVRHFFSAHWERVLAPLPRYWQLFQKRGREIPAGGWDEVVSRFSTADLRDLQVLFNLAWLGFSAADHPEVQALRQRGQDFAEKDKGVVLGHHRGLMERLLQRTRQLYRQGALEISCTPYFHPILPLLIDSNLARRPTPEARLPERFAFPEDAELQIHRALHRMEVELGARPRGLLPPDGAISPETVRLAQQAGLTYLVTDASVLFHSLDETGSSPGRRRVFEPYRMEGCTVLFSDGTFAQRIVRTYPTWEDPEAAAQDFIARVHEVGETARVRAKAPPLVVVTFPGEQPWEAYPQRGRGFLTALGRLLSASTTVRTVTLSEHLAAHPPVIALDYLHSGSCIEGNFAMWIGEPVKNRAWELLGRARRRLERARTAGEVGPKELDEALTHLLRAEGADWFWWLGEPFFSAEDDIYESLFRGFVLAAYRALRDSPPADLSRPIERGGIVSPLRQPSSFIQPRIDGTLTSFFEWRDAGYYRIPAGGSIYQPHAYLSGLHWGFDPGRIYLRLDPLETHREGPSPLLGKVKIQIDLTEPGRRIQARLNLEGNRNLSLILFHGDSTPVELGTVEDVAYQDVVELAIPISRLGLRPGARVGLSLHFMEGTAELAKVPRQGVIELEIPSGSFGETSPYRD